MSTSNKSNIGADISIKPSNKFGDFVFIHPGAKISEDCVINGFTQVWGNVHVESGVSIGAGAILEQPSKNSSGIFLGKGCDVGAGAIILQGVTVGEGAVIKPGAVVEHNVPPYAVVSGNPARVLGYVENLQAGKISPWHPVAEFPSTPAIMPLGVGNVTLHRLKKICDPRGDLSVAEFPKDIPFDPKRYFLVFNVPSEKIRGEHAHHTCHQFLVCVKGSCAVVVDDGKSRCEVVLNSPDMGIHLPPLTWGIQYKYSSDAVLLVFTSDYYDANDYIRDYSEFSALMNNAK